MSDPISNREDYDHVILSGQRSPGIATIEGANSPRRLVEHNGVGWSGARVRFAGVMLSHFKLTLRLYTVDHFADWTDNFSPLVAAPPIGVRAHALDIEHPFLADLGIRAVLIEDVKAPMQTGDGEWTVEIALCEYRNPQPALSAPTGATNGPPESPNEYQIRVLTTEFHELDQAGTLAGPPGAP